MYILKGSHRTKSAIKQILNFFNNNIGKVVNSKQISEISGILEHTRRIRELKNIHNVPIQTCRDNHRLRRDEYLLDADVSNINWEARKNAYKIKVRQRRAEQFRAINHRKILKRENEEKIVHIIEEQDDYKTIRPAGITLSAQDIEQIKSVDIRPEIDFTAKSIDINVLTKIEEEKKDKLIKENLFLQIKHAKKEIQKALYLILRRKFEAEIRDEEGIF